MNQQYYGKKYFSWHRDIGEFGGYANLNKFQKYIRPGDNVIDFGCGGGYLLANLACRQKIGVEINPLAIKQARKKGITVYTNAASLPGGFADVVISNNTLEHVDGPLEELKKLKRSMKKNAKIVFVVPCEAYYSKYDDQDVNKHLYTWSPMNLGNLFTRAGFEVIDCQPYWNKWLPAYGLIRKLVGDRVFELLSYIYSLVSRRVVQIRIVGVKSHA